VAGIIEMPGRLQSVQAADFARNPRPTSSECAGKRTFSEPRNRIYEYAPLFSSGIAEDEARPSTSTDLTA